MGAGSAAKNRPSRPKSVASKAAMLAPSSRPARCRRSGSRAVRMMPAPWARASRAVSNPMPELPSMTRTVCPSRSCSRCPGEELIEAVMVPPGVVVAHAAVPSRPAPLSCAWRAQPASARRAGRVRNHPRTSRAASPPGDTLARPLGQRGSAGPAADVRSADTGCEQSRDNAGRPPTSHDPRPPPTLLGRRSECEELDRLVADALAGRSRVTVLRGEAGVGKSALLDYLSGQVTGWHVARAVGVESEMELAYAGLHQLCAPMLDHLDRLPAPQRDALATVFGRSAGPAPDRFLVGLATLTLFAEVAEQQPLVCIVDDAQWLDRASAQILGFVARRLLAERIAVVCAARTGIGDDVLAGLPELPIRGLGDSDARALLLANVPGPLDAAVCDQIVMESHGNPLALLELPRTWNVADLAGGFGLPSRQPVAGRIEQSYARRLQLLPCDTQLLILTAAAEPLGDPVLLHRAAGTLGIDLAAAGPAQDG